MNQYSIVITTFDLRYKPFLIPLIESVRTLRPHLDIFVMVNGPASGNFDENYRSSLLQFLSHQDRCYPTLFPNFQSLAKLWNRGAITANTNLVLILNDDLDINTSLEPHFFDVLEQTIETESRTFRINGSFSHFLINKIELINVGFFDERLLGIGEEDGDFVWRYHQIYSREIPSINILGISNMQSILADQGFSKGVGHYSQFNREFIKKKNTKRF